jgi:hypothetical protein
MKTVVLNLSGKSIPFIIQFCSMIVLMMTGNLNFLTPTPALADISKAIQALQAAYDAALLGGKPLKTAQRLAKAELLGLMTLLKAYVQLTSGGDEGIIASSGMGIKNAPAPQGIPTQVLNVRLVNNDSVGQASLRWKSIKGTESYPVQTSQTPEVESSWVDAGLSSKASITLTGLPSGKLNWFRVAAFNARGIGPWSGSAQKMIS